MVLEWLWSSGIEELGEHFKNRDFIALLVRFLTTESNQDRIRQWLKDLSLKAGKEQSQATFYDYYRHLLRVSIKAEITSGKGPMSAMDLFTRISEDARHEGFVDGKISHILHATAYELTTHFLDHAYGADLQKLSFEPYLMAVKSLCQNHASCLSALHDVYLAKDPNPKSALAYFKCLSTRRIHSMKPRLRYRIVLLGLKTAELCLIKGCYFDAVSVMDLLRKEFPDEIGLDRGLLETRKANEEEQSLRMLETLATA